MDADAQKPAVRSASRRYGEVTHIRFSDDELASLKAIAGRDGVTASEVVREALRLLKDRDQAREQLRADVQAGFDQLARGEGRVYDKVSGRQLAERIKARGRAARAKKP